MTDTRCPDSLPVLFYDPSMHTHRPDGSKKAYVRLTKEVDALDIANKIGFI